MKYLCRYSYNSNNADRDIAHIMQMQNRYQSKYTGFQLKPASFFRQYFFRKDKPESSLIMIEDDKDTIVGWGYLLKNNQHNNKSHEFMMDIIVEPTVKEQQQLYDKLYREIILWLKRDSRQSHYWRNPGNKIIFLTVNKEVSEDKAISYFVRRNFSLQRNRLIMQRDLHEINQQCRLLQSGLTISRGKLETKSAQFKYLRARNEVFRNDPLTLEGLKWFLPVLKTGTAISIFNRNKEIIGSVIVYWTQNKKGFIVDLFMLPQRRRQGLAQFLLTEACLYLKRHNIDIVALEIEKGNKPAYNFYKKANFKVLGEDLYLTRKL